MQALLRNEQLQGRLYFINYSLQKIEAYPTIEDSLKIGTNTSAANYFSKIYNYSKGFVLESDQLITQIQTTPSLAPGLYTISASSNNNFYNRKIVVR
ncbi:MAG: hypothetical protein J0M08_00720 [Bacteroidetes bacterium]|nr:hypothetical protein [Bacteroidota bacterium]